MRAVRVLQVAGAVTAALLAARRCLLIARVNGASMAPSYSDGDRLLAVRRRYFRPLRPGDVVVSAIPAGIGLPDEGVPLIVKRVAAVAGEPVPGSPQAERVAAGAVYLLGDADRHSLDSRSLGALPLDHIVGVVIGRMSAQSR